MCEVSPHQDRYAIKAQVRKGLEKEEYYSREAAGGESEEEEETEGKTPALQTVFMPGTVARRGKGTSARRAAYKGKRPTTRTRRSKTPALRNNSGKVLAKQKEGMKRLEQVSLVRLQYRSTEGTSTLDMLKSGSKSGSSPASSSDS
ncbi:hypothetical protein MAR_021732 [Mya arenaria]|uniref:Uncharacterized protein n=1 Tax=Mya arenaria TaxID=6604 RepID=A0ABY7E8H3_MYAAR|nr:hypothetical protein MAR_021732 [Mya arenaria]